MVKKSLLEKIKTVPWFELTNEIKNRQVYWNHKFFPKLSFVAFLSFGFYLSLNLFYRFYHYHNISI